MMRKCVLAALVGVIALSSTGALGFEAKRRGVRTSVELKLLSRADLANVRIGAFDPGRVRPRVQQLTDMLLILSARGSDIDAVLRLANGQRPINGRSLFRARVFAVTSGIIHADSAAWCGTWRNDISICQVDCDGGVFSMRRLTGGRGGTRLDIVVGDQDDLDSEFERGFSVNACDYENSHQLRVIPSPGRKIVPLAFDER